MTINLDEYEIVCTELHGVFSEYDTNACGYDEAVFEVWSKDYTKCLTAEQVTQAYNANPEAFDKVADERLTEILND
jgi:hypothetical protein